MRSGITGRAGPWAHQQAQSAEVLSVSVKPSETWKKLKFRVNPMGQKDGGPQQGKEYTEHRRVRTHTHTHTHTRTHTHHPSLVCLMEFKREAE